MHARPGRFIAAGACAYRLRRVAACLVVGCTMLALACQLPSRDASTLMNDPADHPAPTDTTLLELAVALEEGFEADLVVVRVNGEEVLRREDVTTDVRIGLAHAFEVRVEHLPATIEVELPDQRLSGQMTVEADGLTHLSISVVDGVVRFQRTDRFRYL